MIFGIKAKLNNPERLDKSSLNAIQAELKQLDKAQKGLAERTVRYVVDSEDAEVLLDLAGNDQAAHELKLASSDYQYYSKHSKRLASGAASRVGLFKELAEAPGVVFVRLSEVYAACQKGRGALISPQSGSATTWPEWFVAGVTEVMHVRSTTAHRGYLQGEEKDPFRPSIAWLEDTLAAAGEPPELCLNAALDSNEYHVFPVHTIGAYVDPLEMFTGWKEYAKRHEGVLRSMLKSCKADAKIQAIQRLKKFGYDFAPLVDQLVTLATGPAKTVREVAASVLAEHIETARPLVETKLREGSASERNEAAALLWRLCGNDTNDLLTTHAENEKLARVVQTIKRLIAVPEAGEDLTVDPRIELPPLNLPAKPIPLGENAGRGRGVPARRS